MQLFFSESIQNDVLLLDEDESRHCSKVLRLKSGATIHVTDGKGNLYKASIIDVNSKKIAAQITDIKTFFRPSPFLSIAVAPTKNINRYEWFVEKATEIGIHRIVPFFSTHSERKALNIHRLQKIIVAAAKQSQKLFFPEILQPLSFKELVNADFLPNNKFIAVCEEMPKDHLKDLCKQATDTLVLIGPEGDFSAEEIKQANSKGFASVSLGKYRLRTETAALVAGSIITLANDQTNEVYFE